MNKLTVFENALAQLVQNYDINFANPIILRDSDGNDLTVYEFQHRDGWFGLCNLEGEIWTNAAEIVKATGISKQGIQGILNQIFNGPLAEICAVQKTFTPNKRGEWRELMLYDDETVDTIIKRGNKPSKAALSFVKERKAMVKFLRAFMFNHMRELAAAAQAENADLRHELHAASQDANDARAELYAGLYPEHFEGLEE